MKLRYSRRAIQDIADIGRYIRERNPASALIVRNAIHTSLNMLAKYPHAGRVIGNANLHRFAVPRLPYLAFYLVDDQADAVRIVTIRHTARREQP